jgi:hypothetical protein
VLLPVLIVVLSVEVGEEASEELIDGAFRRASA